MLYPEPTTEKPSEEEQVESLDQLAQSNPEQEAMIDV
jgi:hypothetical protein